MKPEETIITIRRARVQDARRIKEIYTPYILHSLFNLEEKVESEQYYEHKIQTVLEKHPFLVASYDNIIVGFVYTSDISHMLQLNQACALSIYVAEEAPIRGIGQALLNAVEEELRIRNYTHLISNIVSSNERSIKFHLKNDFVFLSQFPQAAYKFGQWHDINWYGKPISSITHVSLVEENLLAITYV